MPAIASTTAQARRKRVYEGQFNALDPVCLLQEIRAAQQVLADLAASDRQVGTQPQPTVDVQSFLSTVSTAWPSREIRPTHRKRAGVKHWWRSRVDRFEHDWPLVEQWLAVEPTLTAAQLMARLVESLPDLYAGTAQLRTLQRQIKSWCGAQANALILGALDRRSEARSRSASADLERAVDAESTT